MTTAGLFKVDAADSTKLAGFLTDASALTSEGEGAYRWDLSGTFGEFMALESDNATLVLSETTVTGEATVFNNDYSSAVATITITGNSYELADLADVGSDISTVVLGEVDANLNTGTLNNVTVQTASSTSTYSINEFSYKASGTALTIVAVNKNSSYLSSGTVERSASDDQLVVGSSTASTTVLVNTGTIAVVAENDSVTAIAALESGDDFTIDSQAYGMKVAGLVKYSTDGETAIKFLDNSSDTSYTYDLTKDTAGTNNWGDIYTLTTDDTLGNNVLDLSSSTVYETAFVLDESISFKAASVTSNNGVITYGPIIPLPKPKLQM